MRQPVRFLTHLAVAGIGVTALHLMFGVRTSTAGTIAAILYLAWRFDNRTGSCLPLVALVLVVLGILTALVAVLTMFGG